jgi:hypothetical protein
MNYKLFYGQINQNEDLIARRFLTSAQMVDFIDRVTINRKGECVWLIARDNDTDLFVSERALSIQDFIEKKNTWNCQGTYYLYEFDSLEEAYKMAVELNSGALICYSNQ